jgi:multidrug efflux pump subunit AcrB
MFVASVFGFTQLQQQFFPLSSRTELMIDVRMNEGASGEATHGMIERIEGVLQPLLEPADGKEQPIVDRFTSYVGAGAARFFLALNPDLPNPSFGKIIIQTTSIPARETLRAELKRRFEQDECFSDASLRVLRLEFGPPVGFPVQFRVIGPDPKIVRSIANDVREVMRKEPAALDVNLEWDEPAKSIHIDIDQDRARLMGLAPQEIELGLQTLLSGTPISQYREETETIQVVARAIESERLNLTQFADMTLFTENGRAVPLSQIGNIRPGLEEPIVWRRNQERSLAVRCDVADGFQAPDISGKVEKKLSTLKAGLPVDYRIEAGGAIEESNKANKALFAMFPIMILLMLALLMSQVHSFKKMILIFVNCL